MYPKFFKSLAMRSPILGEIVGERDRLRSEIAIATEELDRLRQQHKYAADMRNTGYCHCCRQETVFEIRGDWLRDQYLCLNCFSIPRQRHIQYVLDSFFKGWEEKNIHESSPANDLISRYCTSYSFSQYFEGVNEGSLIDGVRCENLESLTFPDCTFDIFITQDVFEHILNPERAASEIMRVLKPSGFHVFTAPKNKGITVSYPRARMAGKKIEYIEEAMYHGNPVGDGRALVTWDYGDDFEDLINAWSKYSTTTYITKDRDLGIDGEYIEVFVTKKSI
jgi:SAM-dependent methyltransferase